MSHSHYDKSRDSKPQNTEVKESKPEDIKKEPETQTPVPEVQFTPVVDVVQEEKKEESKVDTPVVKQEPKKEEKKETLKVSNSSVVKTEVPKKVYTMNIGISCKLKSSVKETVNHHSIPEFAYRNTYKVTAILNDRIIIKSGLTYTLAVKPEDVTLI